MPTIHPSPDEGSAPVDLCPDCDAVEAIVGIEWELRTLSLDLWSAGWSPDEILDHVRLSIDDPRAVDLVVHAVLVDDRLRDDQACPPAWRESVERLRAMSGLGADEPPVGWLARWIRECSHAAESYEFAEMVDATMGTLVSMFDERAATVMRPSA